MTALAMSHGEPSIVDAWIEQQQIGIVAHAIEVMGAARADALSSDSGHRATKKLARLIARAAGATATRAGLARLPRSVLSQLHHALQDRAMAKRREFSELARTVADLRANRDTGGPARAYSERLTLAATLAELMLTGRAEAEQLVRATAEIYSMRAQSLGTPLLAAIDNAMDRLRAPAETTAERVARILDLRTSLGTIVPLDWPLIQNCLFARVFCWPLLVSKSRGTPTVGFSLPLAIDVRLADRSVLARSSRIVGGNGILALRDWHETLATASDVARDQWRRKHGNHGDFVRHVERSSITLDLSYAERIARVLAEIGFETPLQLEGRSAGPYLAGAILSKFMGRAFPPPIAATGVIHEPVEGDLDARYPDRYVEAARGVHAKLQFARSSEAFVGVILPENSREFVRRRTNEWIDFASRTELRFGRTMADYSDIAHAGRWRQYHYVGVSHVRRALHTSGQQRGARGQQPSDAVVTETDRVLARLRGNPWPLVELEANPEAVGRALWQINTTLRSAAPRLPPSLSWAMVEYRGEPMDLFWRILWDACGADETELWRILTAGTVDERADALDWLLNRLVPEPDRPSHRSPDLVVIVRRAAASIDGEADQFGLMEAAVRRQSERLAGLIPLDHEGWDPLLGNTRVLLVTEPVETASPLADVVRPLDRAYMGAVDAFDAVDGTRTAERPPNLRWSEREHGDDAEAFLALEALSTLDGEFSPAVGARFLSSFGWSQVEARYLLQRLTSRAQLCWGQGVYHLAADARRPERRDDPGRLRSMAQAEYAAAVAYAPYLAIGHAGSPWQPAHLEPGDLHRSLDPAHTASAVRHLMRAHGMFEASRGATASGGDRAAAARAKGAIARVVRLTGIDGWHVLSLLGQANCLTDAFSMAKRLISVRQRRFGGPTPEQLVAAGATAVRCAHHCRSQGGDALRTYEECTRFASEWLPEAWRRARPMGRWIRALAGSHLADFLRRSGTAERGVEGEITAIVMRDLAAGDRGDREALGLAIASVWAKRVLFEAAEDDEALRLCLLFASTLRNYQDFAIIAVGLHDRLGRVTLPEWLEALVAELAPTDVRLSADRLATSMQVERPARAGDWYRGAAIMASRLGMTLRFPAVPADQITNGEGAVAHDATYRALAAELDLAARGVSEEHADLVRSLHLALRVPLLSSAAYGVFFDTLAEARQGPGTSLYAAARRARDSAARISAYLKARDVEILIEWSRVALHTEVTGPQLRERFLTSFRRRLRRSGVQLDPQTLSWVMAWLGGSA